MKTNKIIIVGGGTAGYVSALILKTTYPKLEIKVVKSNKIGIIGVGEGSTEHWKIFMDVVGISYKEIIKECDATLKGGVMFKNWSDKDYFHNVTDLYEIKNAQHLIAYMKLVADDVENFKFNDLNFIKNKISKNLLKENNSPVNQYHFNTFKLNDFLHKKSVERGIDVIEDEILDVNLNEQGEISNLKGEKNNYSSDFYIDCTGFKKLLISKLGAKWQSYGKYLKMKEAIAFPTKDTDEYNLYTVAQAMDYGWTWHIPTYGRWGNGYIFDSDYINADQAKQEVEKYMGHEIEVGRQVKFDPGCLDKPWIKNCLAVGLSANFVEPLEATSIGTSIYQLFLFTHYFDNYNQLSIDDFNNKMTLIMNNIRDFIVLHYITKKEDTSFWKNLKTIELPDTLKTNLERWQTRLPILEDFKGTNYYLFFEANFVQVLYGLNLLNIKNIKNMYENVNEHIKKDVEKKIKDNYEGFNNITIGHKDYLNIIRNTNA